MSSKENNYQYIILHGCPPSEALITPHEKRWMNWLADELNKKGLSAIAPDMPRAWEAKYQDWKKEFEKFTVDNQSILIGHSCGAAFLVRWLLEKGVSVKKLILVAPAKIPEGDTDPRADLYKFDLPSDLPHLADEVVLFTSNDFPHHILSKEMYLKALQPRHIELKGKGHFLFFQMETNVFPELLSEAIKQ